MLTGKVGMVLDEFLPEDGYDKGQLYEDTPATARATHGETIGDLTLTVLDTDPDNFGSYVGDGIDDGWQVFHFGLDNPLAGPLMDPDGNGQNNLFKFTADCVRASAALPPCGRSARVFR